MSDFIVIGLAQALPISLFFLLGVFLAHKGLRRIFVSTTNFHPVILFLVYWFISAAAIVKLFPALNGSFSLLKILSWLTEKNSFNLSILDLIGICAPLVGVVIFLLGLLDKKVKPYTLQAICWVLVIIAFIFIISIS
jgi:hypothetical protein